MQPPRHAFPADHDDDLDGAVHDAGTAPDAQCVVARDVHDTGATFRHRRFGLALWQLGEFLR